MATNIGAPSRPVAGRAVRTAAALDGRIAGVLLFGLGAWFLTAIMLGASIAPGYDYSAAAISDLGVIGQTAVLFNVTLLAVGVLNLAGGYFFYRQHRSVAVFVPFVLAAIGAIGAGIFPLSTGTTHSLFALVAFVFFNVEAIATAFVVPPIMSVISALAGIVGLVYVVLMVIGDGGNPVVFWIIGHGGTERMIAYPAMLWLVGLGGYLIGRRPADVA